MDDRGQLAFVNDFSFGRVKRFYMVENHQSGMIRAWHAHKHEEKYVFVACGAAIVAAVEIDDWDHPSPNANISRFVLSEKKPAILHIPSGYANGFMNLTPHAKVIFFSTSSVEESRGDDIRYDARYWNPWEIIER